MNCFMFPGQPMSLASIPFEDPLFREKARSCQTASGFDLLDADQSGLHLSDSIRLQLFGTAMSLYRFDLLIGQHGPPQMIAEHSMGIYPALAACGSIDSRAAFELTYRIGSCLAAFGNQRQYALGSVVGLTGERVAVIASNHGVFIANYNTSRHFLLAGQGDRIRSAAIEAEAAGAFSAAVFPCDAPLHTPLLDEIADELHTIVCEYTFAEPQIPLIDHCEQKNLDASRIPRFVVEELCRPVFWEVTYRALQRAGVTRFYEAGAGQALTKFNRWIDSQL